MEKLERVQITKLAADEILNVLLKYAEITDNPEDLLISLEIAMNYVKIICMEKASNENSTGSQVGSNYMTASEALALAEQVSRMLQKEPDTNHTQPVMSADLSAAGNHQDKL